MPPDPLTHPIAALTAHPVLSPEAEAALVAALRAGAAAQAAIAAAPPPVDPALLHQAAQGQAARTTLARHNLRLVVSIAKRYARTAGPHLSLEDLIGFGSIGLLTGIDKFDPAKGRKLSTYVTWWIRQAIGRGIATQGRLIHLPVHVHERIVSRRQAQGRLSQQLGRDPMADEVAAALGVRPAQVAQLDTIAQDLLSLNAPIRATDDRLELGDALPDPAAGPEEQAVATTLRRDLAAALLRCLTDRERRVLVAAMGLDGGPPQSLEAIGAAEGVSRERARQLVAGALARLRADPVIAGYREVAGAG